MESKEDRKFEQDPTIEDKTTSLFRLLDGRGIDTDRRIDRMIRLYGSVTDNKNRTPDEVEQLLEKFELPITSDQRRIRKMLLPEQIVESVPFFNQKMIKQYRRFTERSNKLMKMTHRLKRGSDVPELADYETRIIIDRAASSEAMIKELDELLAAVQEGIDEHRRIYGHYQKAVLDVQSRTRATLAGVRSTTDESPATLIEEYDNPLLKILQWSTVGLTALDELQKSIATITSDDGYQMLRKKYNTLTTELKKYTDPSVATAYLKRLDTQAVRTVESMRSHLMTLLECAESESDIGRCVERKVAEYDDRVIGLGGAIADIKADGTEGIFAGLKAEWSPLNDNINRLRKQIESLQSIDPEIVGDYSTKLLKLIEKLLEQPYLEFLIGSLNQTSVYYTSKQTIIPDLFKVYIGLWRNQTGQQIGGRRMTSWYNSHRKEINNQIGINLITHLFAKTRGTTFEEMKMHLGAIPTEDIKTDINSLLGVRDAIKDMSQFFNFGGERKDRKRQLTLLGFNESVTGLVFDPDQGGISWSRFATIVYRTTLNFLHDQQTEHNNPFRDLFTTGTIVPGSQLVVIEKTKKEHVVTALNKMKRNHGTLYDWFNTIGNIVFLIGDGDSYQIKSTATTNFEPQIKLQHDRAESKTDDSGTKFAFIRVIEINPTEVNRKRLRKFRSLVKQDSDPVLEELVRKVVALRTVAQELDVDAWASIDSKIEELRTLQAKDEAEIDGLMETEIEYYIQPHEKVTKPLNKIGPDLNLTTAEEVVMTNRARMIDLLIANIEKVTAMKEDILTEHGKLKEQLETNERERKERSETLARLADRNTQVKQAAKLRGQMREMVLNRLHEDQKPMFTVYDEMFEKPFENLVEPQTLFRMMMSKLINQAIEMNKQIREFYPHLYGKMVDLNQQLASSPFLYDTYLTGGAETIEHRFTDAKKITSLFESQGVSLKRMRDKIIMLNRQMETLKKLISKSNSLIDRYQRYSLDALLSQISLIDSMVWAIEHSAEVTQTISRAEVTAREGLLQRFQNALNQPHKELDKTLFHGLSQNFRSMLNELNAIEGDWYGSSERTDLKTRGLQRVNWIWFEYFTVMMRARLGEPLSSRPTEIPAPSTAPPPAPSPAPSPALRRSTDGSYSGSTRRRRRSSVAPPSRSVAFPSRPVAPPSRPVVPSHQPPRRNSGSSRNRRNSSSSQRNTDVRLSSPKYGPKYG